ncbi:MAG: iron-containing alcohol dehydrogenase [Sphaerochaetaceae bacterium]|nr:iron-containing alcohol dehydrogenase [Sphaerochaetaceae bacterium]
MISGTLTPVHVLSFEDIDAYRLHQILGNAAGRLQNLTVALVRDDAPIPRRDELINGLREYCAVTTFNKVRPNPTCADIMEMFGSSAFRKADVVLAIGGGSVMDSAKALAMLATNGGELEQYLGNQPQRGIVEKSLPLVLIPTTAGTGSEVTKVGVYSSESGRKHTLGSPSMLAHTALLVGSFIDTVPAKLCASTGLDALDHALESIWNKNATDITRRAAEDAAVEVLTWLPKLYQATQNGNADRLTQQKMLQASCMAGIAFSITGTAAGHAISFILSEDWHVPHGMACAFTLMEIFDIAMEDPATRTSLARISGHFHPELKEQGELIATLRGQIASLMREMKIPRTFQELSVELSPDEIPSRFERSFFDPKMHNQKPAISPDRLYALLVGKL